MLIGVFPTVKVRSRIPRFKEAPPENVESRISRIGIATFSRFSPLHSIVNRDERITRIADEDA
jgi:hypothetical protein